MGLKILHSADWHLDSPFTGVTPDQQTYLKEAQRKIPAMVADLCRRENCDLVLLSGDLFDGPATKDSVENANHLWCRVCKKISYARTTKKIC